MKRYELQRRRSTSDLRGQRLAVDLIHATHLIVVPVLQANTSHDTRSHSSTETTQPLAFHVLVFGKGNRWREQFTWNRPVVLLDWFREKDVQSLLARFDHFFLPPTDGAPDRSSRSFRLSLTAAVSLTSTPEANPPVLSRSWGVLEYVLSPDKCVCLPRLKPRREIRLPCHAASSQVSVTVLSVAQNMRAPAPWSWSKVNPSSIARQSNSCSCAAHWVARILNDVPKDAIRVHL